MQSTKNKSLALNIYLLLTGLFITSLVVSNLIFQKFFYWYPLGKITLLGSPIFQISVGIIPYPITFLITDLVSEIYGKSKANKMVVIGIFTSIFAMGIVYLADLAPAIKESGVNDKLFHQVFGQTVLAVTASMIAYLCAQFIDIKIYHFFKKATKGNHLWLRNNFSTFTSQGVDTASVLLLLCSFGTLPWNLFLPLFISGFLFKITVALIDTPILYGLVFLMRKKFNLTANDDLTL